MTPISSNGCLFFFALHGQNIFKLNAHFLGIITLTIISTASAQQWTTSSLSVGRHSLAATSLHSLALFGGGYGNCFYGYCNTVDIYNATSGTWTNASLSVGRENLAAASVGDVALFGGGYNNTGSIDTVDIYNVTTGVWSTATLSIARYYLAATSVGDVALFGGGASNCQDMYCQNSFATVDIYNTTTRLWSTATLSVARYSLAATSAGDVALFGGGYNNDKTVDIYNVTSRMWSTATLSVGRYSLVAASLGSIAFFAGGYNGGSCMDGGNCNIVDIYDAMSGKWSTAVLSVGREKLAATAVGNYVLFGGGADDVLCNSDGNCNTVDLYDASTDTWNTATLSVARSDWPATTLGNLALFAGGRGGCNIYQACSTVDIYNYSAPTSSPSTPPDSGSSSAMSSWLNQLLNPT